MSRLHDSRASFRCAIAPEYGAARLRINGKSVACRVMETSCDAFSIAVDAKYSSRLLNSKSRLVLEYRDEKWLVSVHSHFKEGDTFRVGLCRERDLTKFKQPSSMSGMFSASQFSMTTDPSFLLALMVAFLLCCICLPGIGDSLGTAPRVREGVNSMFDYVTEAIH